MPGSKAPAAPGVPARLSHGGKAGGRLRTGAMPPLLQPVLPARGCCMSPEQSWFVCAAAEMNPNGACGLRKEQKAKETN